MRGPYDRRMRLSGNAGSSNGLASAFGIILAATIFSAAAILINYALFAGAGLPFLWVGLIGTLVISLATSIPLLLWNRRQTAQLVRTRQELTRVSSADHLTGCLDGSVFFALVEAFRAPGDSTGRPGALLIIDIDRFREIAGRFGRSWSDEALRVIANVIRGAVRSGDLVGRLSGQEFGIFLPGASKESAEVIAERIRGIIAETLYEPGGKQCLLTVSVGGVVFQHQIVFDELMKAAELQLDTARHTGGNRTSILMLAETQPNAQPLIPS